MLFSDSGSLSPPIVQSTKLIRDSWVTKVLMTECLVCGINSSSSSGESENAESLDAGLMALKLPPGELCSAAADMARQAEI